MCLDSVMSKKKSDEIIKLARKRGYIRVYKVCDEDPWFGRGHTKRTGVVFGGRYKTGVQESADYKNNTNAGWYGFLTLKAAEKYSKYAPVKVCYAKPQWIKRLGRYYSIGQAGIFTHLAFPDWKKGRMTVKEFRQMCKDYNDK